MKVFNTFDEWWAEFDIDPDGDEHSIGKIDDTEDHPRSTTRDEPPTR